MTLTLSVKGFMEDQVALKQMVQKTENYRWVDIFYVMEVMISITVSWDN